jgi:3-hydroxyisobutyrate dehydrogenase-like beta-hydroxyacid dehydrogenase
VDNTIAWLGLGHMGAPMARRILDHGHHLTVWNRSPQRATPLAEAGAQVARSPAAAAASADLVITMLSDSDALNGVLFGDNGALAGMRPGGILVQMSTIGPQAVREIAGKLPSGAELVDAPVVGSTPAAVAGSLTVLAAGNAAALDRVEPTLSELGNVRRCGELGSGSAMKLVVNTGMVVSVAAVADALAVADAVGVSREAALSAMQTGPLSGVVSRVTGPAQFSVALSAKDLSLAMNAAGVPLPVTEGAAKRLNDAIAVGLADRDLAAIV